MLRKISKSFTILDARKVINIFELRNAKIYGLFEQKYLEDKEILRPEDLNFCVS